MATHPLSRALNAYFKAPAQRQPDTHRKAREEAQRLALAHSIEVERLKEGGFIVWPPRSLDDSADPYHGDHYCGDWSEVVVMVRDYAELTK
jgi:hypothetical protein